MLEAIGVASGIATAGSEHVLLVPAEDADRAVVELFRYVRENRDKSASEEALPPLEWSVTAAVGYALVLLAFDVAVRRGWLGIDFLRAGAAAAAAIRAGAWWRSVTALSLHADALHLASNLVFGAAFGVMLAQSVGVGVAWLAFVLTGGIGNWINAWIQSPAHASIGASTAIFGMLGVQVAHDWVRRRELHDNRFRRYAPIAVGAALFAWLGGDGRPIQTGLKTIGDIDLPLPRIDVGAHLLGFALGLCVGAVVGWTHARHRPSQRMQAVLAGSALLVFALAWLCALR